MKNFFAGKTVLITGGGKNIGKRIAEGFFSLKTNVVVNDILPEEESSLKDKLLASNHFYYSQGNIGAGVTNTLTALANIGCFLFNEYLAIGKMQEYRKVKSALDEHGWDERIIEPKSHSWCQRNMVQIASDDAGFGKETRNYFHEKGYKWYHFISNF